MNQLKITLLCLVFTCFLVELSAQHRSCGHDAHMKELLEDPEFAKEFYKNQKIYKERAAILAEEKAPCTTPLIIPVAVHYNGSVNTSNTQCLIDAALAQVAQMNLDFSSCNANAGDLCSWINAGCTNFGGSAGANAMPEDGACMQFCLADQNLPSGEDNIGGYGITVGDYTWTGSTNNAPAWGGCMNIFVENGTGGLGVAILNAGANPAGGNGFQVEAYSFGAAGFAGCNSGTNIGTDNTFGNGATSTHEAGHHFGLEHTWDDPFPDTPAQTNPNTGCPTVNTTTCTSSAGSDYGANFMDYPDDDCMSIFTDDQVTKMLATAASQGAWATNMISCWTDWQNGTLTYSSCVTGPCGNTTPPVAAINPTGSTIDICSNGANTISFSDASSNTPNAWSWTFSGSASFSPASSTAANPTVTITGGGSLTATLTATNSNGSDTKTENYTINYSTCTSTTNEYCNSPNIAIPDNNSTGISTDITVPAGGTISELDLDVVITHTYVGDIFIEVEHGGVSVVLMDRPGVPASTYGCNQGDIDVTFDDEASTAVEGVCSSNPAIGGSVIPQEALSAFDGMDQSGIWTITVSDNVGQDTGTFDDWCLTITSDAGSTNCYAMLTGSNGLAATESGVADYESSDWIESSSVLQNGSSVDYDAANYVVLKAGFQVDQGAVFQAFIDGCDDGGGGVNLNGDEGNLGKKYIKKIKEELLQNIEANQR